MFCNWIHVWVHSSYPEQKQDPHHDFDIKYIFFIYEQKQARLNFWVSVSWREKTQRIRQNYKQIYSTYFFKDVLGESKFFRIQVFQNSQSFENFFSNKDMMLACVFNSFVLLKILCLAKWEVNLVCSCSHRLLSLTDSGCDPVSKWALKQKTAGNLSLGAWDR